MCDFDRQWARMERQGTIIRRIAFLWIAFVAALVIGGVALAGYSLFHPEVIGEFVGRIVAGLEAGRG